MKRFKIIQVVLVVGMLVIVGGLVGCGSSSNECSCEICVNDVPAYPSDSEASCAAFAADKSCTSNTYTNSATDTCGANPQPVCHVSGCSDACNTCQ
jgi:hypothetical protein